MIGSTVTTLLIGLIAMAPGILLARGRATVPGQYAAAACASLVLAMLVTALLGFAWHSMTDASVPAWALLPVSLAGAGVACFCKPATPTPRPPVEWQGLAVAGIMVVFGFAVQAMAVRENAEGALLVHAWYNADWFKHLGHVAALANYGVPARDIFNAMEPLHYYWLSYLLPGAGSSLSGHTWATLSTANAIITVLLCLTLYGVVRLAVTHRTAALLATLATFFVCAPLSVLLAYVTSGAEFLLNGPGAPREPVLMAFSLYIPQHALALATLLAWFLLDRPSVCGGRALRRMGLGALSSVLAISTLLGAMLLSAYGLQQLWRYKLRAVWEIVVMALAAAGVLFTLGVLKLGDPGSAIASPLLTNDPPVDSLAERIVVGFGLIAGKIGLPLFLAIGVLRYWRPKADDRTVVDVWRMAIVLILTMFLFMLAAEPILTSRLLLEARLRAPSVATIGVAIILAWALERSWYGAHPRRKTAVAIGTIVLLAALPSAVMRTIWHGNLDDRFTTTIPANDRAVLAHIQRQAAATEIVWQFPEPPLLANPSGRDSWVVAIAGRPITGSLRATDFADAEPRIAHAAWFFSGDAQATIPGDVVWIYLSRTLHPASYDTLVGRMRSEPAWRQSVCHPDACLFERVEPESQ